MHFDQSRVAGLSPAYARIMERLDLYPRGVQAWRLVELLRPWDAENKDEPASGKEIKSLRSKLANLESKGLVTIERTTEYGNIYRPVGSYFDMSNWTIEGARDNYVKERAERFGADQLPVAAYSMMLDVWRNTIVEDAHAGSGLNRISDGEMMAANVAVFRLCREFLMTGDPSRAAWLRLLDELILPVEGIKVGSRNVADLLGEHYQEWMNSAASSLMYWADLTEREDHDMEWFIAVKSCFGRPHREWFGMPDWPQLVDAFVAKEYGGSTSPADAARYPDIYADGVKPREKLPIPDEELRAGLLKGPDHMDPKVLDWCIGDGIGYMKLDRD
ncbi:hypothetical protein DFR74_1418 [Nocardia puris]|uniref:Uncharacterized protein n=2 Tax=Nocardia puris TaxID=208602 RepID=A0A366CSW9_9NOCA|nr:hypothetical protein DFR74_1418 [Nocardia puris]